MWFRFDDTVYLEPRVGQNNLDRTAKGKKLKQTGSDPEERKKQYGAVKRTRTSTGCPTATSTLRVYQFRHDRTTGLI